MDDIAGMEATKTRLAVYSHAGETWRWCFGAEWGINFPRLVHLINSGIVPEWWRMMKDGDHENGER